MATRTVKPNRIQRGVEYEEGADGTSLWVPGTGLDIPELALERFEQAREILSSMDGSEDNSKIEELGGEYLSSGRYGRAFKFGELVIKTYHYYRNLQPRHFYCNAGARDILIRSPAEDPFSGLSAPMYYGFRPGFLIMDYVRGTHPAVLSVEMTQGVRHLEDHLNEFLRPGCEVQAADLDIANLILPEGKPDEMVIIDMM